MIFSLFLLLTLPACLPAHGCGADKLSSLRGGSPPCSQNLLQKILGLGFPCRCASVICSLRLHSSQSGRSGRLHNELAPKEKARGRMCIRASRAKLFYHSGLWQNEYLMDSNRKFYLPMFHNGLNRDQTFSSFCILFVLFSYLFGEIF